MIDREQIESEIRIRNWIYWFFHISKPEADADDRPLSLMADDARRRGE